MSYRIQDYGHLGELAKVRSYFGLTLDVDWLNNVQVVLSADNALLALAHGEKMAIFSQSVPDSLGETVEIYAYVLKWLGTLANPNEIITAVLCLSWWYPKESGRAYLENILVVGLDTGAVLFYDENGTKLYSQRFILEPVISIKNYFPATYNSSNNHFLLYVLYDTSLIILKSTDFMEKIVEIKQNTSKQFNQLQINQIDYYYHYEFPIADYKNNKKTLLYDGINDVIVIPHQIQFSYDLLIESSCNGSAREIGGNNQQYNLIISIGSKNFLQFHKAKEPKQKILQSEEGGKIKLQMETFCRIEDERREGKKVFLSHNNLWAAVVDNLERVLLIDVARRQIVRIWKGYPEAQCGFTYTTDDPVISTDPGLSLPSHISNQHFRRAAIFLQIYVPSLGRLEIWSLLYGNKLALFNLCKAGQLIYKTPTPVDMESKSTDEDCKYSNCFFLDPNDGLIKVIEIPFYYALDNASGEISIDMQNLRTLKNLLEKQPTSCVRNCEELLIDIQNICKQFQTTVGREQCLKLSLCDEVIKYSSFTTILNGLYEKITEDLSKLDENRKLKRRESLEHELSIFLKYKELDEFVVKLQKMMSCNGESKIPVIKLATTDYELTKQWLEDLELINHHFQKDEDDENFSTDIKRKTEEISPVHCERFNEDFLALILKFCIKFNFAPLESNCKKGFLDFFCLASERHLRRENGLQIFRKALLEINELNAINLMKFIFNFWLEDKCTYKSMDEALQDMTVLCQEMRLIYEIMDPIKEKYYDYNDTIAIWQDLREVLLNYTQPTTMLVVITCKTLALEIIYNQTRKYESPVNINEKPSVLEENWENISQEETQWMLLISKMEPALIISAIFRSSTISMNLAPQMPVMSLSVELENCSLKTILTGGKGIITDLIAQWLIQLRIHPKQLCKVDSNQAESLVSKAKGQEPIIQLILLVKRYFPYSIESRLLLCLMTWHYMFYWSKHLEELQYFDAALTCLRELKTEDCVLKQKVCCLLWRATIKIPFQLIAKLLQKIGHLPTEKLCQQELGMSAVAITRFLELSLQFLLELNQTEADGSSKIGGQEFQIRYEDNILVDGPEPIQALIVKQKPVIALVLNLHIELSYVLHFMTFFQLKYLKPLTKLFDSARYATFFVDINTEDTTHSHLELNERQPQQLPPIHADLQTARLNFLRKSITASLDLLRTNVDGTIFTQEYIKFTKRVLSLTNLWLLDKQIVFRQQVIDLYAHDYDIVAHDMLKMCEGDANMTPKLLEIAGLRLNLYVSESSHRFRIMAKSPKLLKHQDYLANCTSNDENNLQISAIESTDINLENLKDLVLNAMKFMEFLDPKQKHLVGVANEMYYVCMEFLTLNKLKDKPYSSTTN